MNSWEKPYIRTNRTWLKSNMPNKIANKVLEVLSCTGKSIEGSNNNRLLTLMLRYKLRSIYGAIILRYRWCEIKIMDISCPNIYPIKISVGEGYVETITWENSCIPFLIRLRWMKVCSNIADFLSEVHIHIKYDIAYEWTLLTAISLPLMSNVIDTFLVSFMMD